MNETIHAPDFPYDFQWVNTSQPLSLYDDLANYVLLVYFWTSSNVNCHHVLPTVEYLERRFANRSFRAVGVHTGKFSAERDAEHITAMVRRFGLRHAIVIDEAGELWKSYEAKAWPFFALVDASGHFRFHGAGEPDRARMASGIESLLDEAAAEGLEPYHYVQPEEYDAPEPRNGLRFPTGLAHDAARGWLWIADSARHRIVAIDPTTAAVQLVVGSGEPGSVDGELETARFYQPQALSVIDRGVLVADAGNHLLRRVDLDEGRVDTVLGTGQPVVDLEGGGSGPAQPINSPWALAARGDELFVAMAGQHQLWRVELDTMTAVPFAGSKTKGVHDGSVYEASFAQPAALAWLGDHLFVLDSDSSALRRVDVAAGEVSSPIPGALYEWGCVDGAAPKMQFPRALAVHGTDLYIADTFNDKLRRFRDGELSTLDVELCRPEGLAVAGDLLFVADTGNHRIVRLDLAGEGLGVETPPAQGLPTEGLPTEVLPIGGLPIEVLPIGGLPLAPTGFATDWERCAVVTWPPNAAATLRIPLDLPDGVRLDPGAYSTLAVENLEGHPLLVDAMIYPDQDGDELVARGLDTGEEGAGVMRLALVYATAPEHGEIGHVLEHRYEVPVTIAADADPGAADADPGAADVIPSATLRAEESLRS